MHRLNRLHRRVAVLLVVAGAAVAPLALSGAATASNPPLTCQTLFGNVNDAFFGTCSGDATTSGGGYVVATAPFSGHQTLTVFWSLAPAKSKIGITTTVVAPKQARKVGCSSGQSLLVVSGKVKVDTSGDTTVGSTVAARLCRDPASASNGESFNLLPGTVFRF